MTTPLETLRVNVEGTASVFLSAVTNHVSKVVFTSTGAIYPSLETALEESQALDTPSDIYGLSKGMDEKLAHYYVNRESVGCTIARLFNAFGPYETNPHLIPHIIQSLKAHPTYIELGNIHTKRDYVFVEDIAAGLLATVEKSNSAGVDVVNIGTGAEYSALDIVRIIEESLGHVIHIHQDPKRLRPVDKLHQIAGTKKMEEEYGWRAKYDMRTGLQALLAHEGLM